jgi:hypothetical protein
MRQFMMTMMALVAFGAMVAAAQAENQTPPGATKFSGRLPYNLGSIQDRCRLEAVAWRTGATIQ